MKSGGLMPSVSQF